MCMCVCVCVSVCVCRQIWNLRLSRRECRTRAEHRSTTRLAASCQGCVQTRSPRSRASSGNLLLHQTACMQRSRVQCAVCIAHVRAACSAQGATLRNRSTASTQRALALERGRWWRGSPGRGRPGLPAYTTARTRTPQVRLADLHVHAHSTGTHFSAARAFATEARRAQTAGEAAWPTGRCHTPDARRGMRKYDARGGATRDGRAGRRRPRQLGRGDGAPPSIGCRKPPARPAAGRRAPHGVQPCWWPRCFTREFVDLSAWRSLGGMCSGKALLTKIHRAFGFLCYNYSRCK